MHLLLLLQLQDVADSFSNESWMGVQLPIDLLSASIETFLREIEVKTEAARKRARIITPTDELEGVLTVCADGGDSSPLLSKQLFAGSEGRMSNPAPAALENNAISLPQPAAPMVASPLRGDAAVDAAPEVDSETERNLEQVLESRRELFGELYSGEQDTIRCLAAS